ncbi:MAG: sigma-70 family RNA polymerase sigma factor [Bacteroidales bacterium]|nr:sigma-70 family RNA polymerase sigma factor [Bacteroidales bacterium]
MLIKTASLTDWVEAYTSDLYSWALHKVSDPELAKDLVQDTFLAAAEKIDGFRGDSAPKTWLLSILNNRIIDIYRKKVKQPIAMENDVFQKFFDSEGSWKKSQQPSNWHDEENHLLDDTDFQKVLKKCLDALPDKWNTCVKLKYLMEKKGEEICQELEITPTNLWQIIHRAKLQLRGCIEDNWFKN